MNFDDLLLQILDEYLLGKKVDIKEYCDKYPQYKDVLLSKFRTAEFLKNSFKEEDLSGKKLGDYLILRELARGGMGIVFLAIQPSLSRLTAIKVLPPNFIYDKDALKNFQEEAKVIAKFNHPNIVPIYSISEEKNLYYIAMGYIFGPSIKNIIEHLKNKKSPHNIKVNELREIIRQVPIEKQDISQKSITMKRDEKFWNKSYFQFIATIASEITDALSYAHQNGIYHGDLKPSNILLTNELTPMIVDFGLSKDINKISSSKDKEFVGTLAYAAPEQIRNNTINDKTDIWSLGVTLYELLTFKNPFQENTVEKTANKILKGYPMPLRHFNKKIPVELEAIILKCMENTPGNRYSSVSELTVDLKNFIESKPIKAKPDWILKRFKKAAIRKPIISLLIFLFCILFSFSFSFISKILIEKMHQNISRNLNKGNYTSAFEQQKTFTAIAKYYPFAKKMLPDIYSNIGYHYYLKEEYNLMYSWFQKALDEDQNNFPALMGLGRYYGAMGMHEEAMKTYKKVFVITPNHPALLEDVAVILFREGISSNETDEIINYLSPFDLTEDNIRDVWDALKQVEIIISRQSHLVEQKDRDPKFWNQYLLNEKKQ